MTLIDDQVRRYQQQNINPNVRFQSNPQTSALTQGTQSVDSTPQADTFQQKGKGGGIPTPLYIFGTWLGLNKLMDAFNNNCTKDYDKTLMSKLGRFGDWLTDKYGNSRIVQGTKNRLSSFKTSAKAYIDRTPILSAMFNTPTKPENSNVVSFMETQQHADLKEATNTLTKYLEETPHTLKEAGATKAEIQQLKQKYGTSLFGKIKNQKRAVQELEFIRLGGTAQTFDALDPTKIAEELKKLKMSHLGVNEALCKEFVKDPLKYEQEIIEACKRGGKTAKAIQGRALGSLTKRSTNLGMSYNKLISGSKHTSKLGQFLAKMPKFFMRGLTFGGGKYNSLFVALGLGMAVKNTVNAPKEQKVGTAVGGTVDAVSWIASMPLAIKLMHSVNGLQYLGKNKAEVDKFRKALEIFNKNVDKGVYKNEAAYNKAWNAIKTNLKAPKTPLTGIKKYLAKLGSGLSVALELPKPFKEATAGLSGGAKRAAQFRNIKRMLPMIGKNAIGYPLRFAIYMCLCEPLVNKVISGITSAIFGKPYEEPETEGVNEGVNPAQNPTTQNINKPEQSKQQAPVNIDNMPDDNLIKQTANGEHIMTDPPYIPSEKCEIEGIISPYDSKDREYIPAETPAPIPSHHDGDRSLVDSAITRADKVEAQALKVLNGIY